MLAARSKKNQEGELEGVAVLYGSEPEDLSRVRCTPGSRRPRSVMGHCSARSSAGRIGRGRLTARMVGEWVMGEEDQRAAGSIRRATLRIRCAAAATSEARANKSEAAIMRQGR